MKQLLLDKTLNHYLAKFPESKRTTTISEIKEIIRVNNTIANTLGSANYKKLAAKIRASLPDIFSGEISCVDGRLPSFITHLPKITRTWKEPAAIAQSSNFEDRLPTRLAIAIKSHFDKYSDKPLIEYVQTHTSLGHQNTHGCGAVKLALNGNGIDFKDDGGLAWNIRQLQSTTLRALKNQAGENLDLLTVIIEVLDTDTAGIILGLDRYISSPITQKEILKLLNENKILSTSDIYHKFHQELKNISKVFPQQFLKLLKAADQTYEVADLIDKTSNKIQANKLLTEYLDKILHNLYPQAKPAIKQMIKHRLIHNLSFGLLSGFFKDPYSNTFNHHHERYISIGEIGIGDEAVSLQAFRVNHTGYKQINDDLTIMLNLMETNGEVKPPFIVFLVEPVAKKLYLEDPFAQTIQRAKTQLAKLRRVILNNPALSAKISQEKFIILPTIVEEKNQEVLEIPMFY